MLQIVVFTLFEGMFHGILEESMLKRAQDTGLVRVDFVNFRDFAQDKHRTVDDYPFGGGAGMVLKPDPLIKAVESLPVLQAHQQERRFMMSPQGVPFSQPMAEELATLDRLVLVCGHYEGFDERIRPFIGAEEVSIGDFVLTGGEIPAMAIMDAVIRLLPGTLGNAESHVDDSFSTGLLEYPQYTRPASYRGHEVPAVLLSGDHAKVDAWRRAHALYRTFMRRPDLLDDATLTEADHRLIERFRSGDFSMIEVRDGFEHDIPE
ncbi:tRNA (guanosine(37)-N1)-methyltransferase TrmD [Alicyclobacillus mengziensis]|uniref:tRNA (guanine-N(1)-)-methyltransferase n=1 Tax=Alicyclobacillus mengziensis TaxID=2931921 RepID=A0A9X7W4E2_9BACL|nr:tRNA (guanosine(37)-N1)-methyltransferase TrmD [Alicyclobacillus mengziensis]QSO49538.1 tRNA (guanosine(37)-N1)-methyltransferase TrmD [Alicyclobacillus mengziensis]